MASDWIPTVWRDTFEEMLDDGDQLDYEDHWSFNFNYGLSDSLTKQEKRRGWKVYSHCAYGKFRCGSCSKSWKSARVVVLFRYRLRDAEGRGTVIMRPFGQACRRCRDAFELPGFSQKEVEEALLRLFGKIRKNCYGDEDDDDDDDDDGSACSEKVWTKPHDKALCEACIQGICCQDE